MWGNIAKLQGVIGNAVDQVKKFQNELESSLDAAVGADTIPDTILPTNDTGKSKDIRVAIVSPVTHVFELSSFVIVLCSLSNRCKR